MCRWQFKKFKQVLESLKSFFSQPFVQGLSAISSGCSGCTKIGFHSKLDSMEKIKMNKNNTEILKTKNSSCCGCIILLLILLPIIIALALLERNWRAWDDFYSLFSLCTSGFKMISYCKNTALLITI